MLQGRGGVPETWVTVGLDNWIKQSQQQDVKTKQMMGFTRRFQQIIQLLAFCL